MPTADFMASVVEYSDDAIITKNLNGVITSWNRAAERIFGYSAQEAIGQPISIIAAPDRPDELPEILGRLREGERIDHYQTVRKTKYGRLVNISLTVSPVKNSHGEVIGASKIARDITEQVRANERLAEMNAALLRSEAETRQTRDWLETMLRGIGDAVIATDASGKITLLNTVAETLTGWQQDDAIGRPLDEVFVIANEETGESVENPVSKALREGRVVGLANHTRLTTRDGRHIPIDDSAAPFRNADGTILGVVLVFRDITARKEAERAIHEDLSGLHRLHEYRTRLIQATDLPSLLTEVLTAARTITDAEMGNIQLLGPDGSLRIAVHHGFTEPFLDFFQRVEGTETASGAALAKGERIVVKDVEQSPIFAGTSTLDVMLAAGARAVQSTPIMTRNGALIGMLSTHYRAPREPSERDLRLIDLLSREAADLIEKARAEESLRVAQQELESITDNMAAAVTRCTSDFRYGWVSRAYAAWLGQPREAIAGRYIRDVVGRAGYERIRPYMERVLTGEKVEYTAKINFLTTGERWIHAVYIPAYLGDRIDGWIAVVVDITDAVKVENQLREANVNLAHANEDLSHFAFAASHDLQEPLRMITAYSQLLIKAHEGDTKGDTALYIQYISDGTRRMKELLGDLLTYTQMIDDGRESLLDVIDLNLVFEKTLAACKHSIEETNAVISSDHLPSVIGQAAHFAEIFQNLITNALKYRGPSIPRIHVSVINEDGTWRLAVSDNGIGIAPEYHERIFGVFKRLHGTEIPGTGMGLAICKRAVERYGGRIWVESEVGRGATFYLTLPAVKVAAAHES
jgi:PAS domain S-box-containing protein